MINVKAVSVKETIIESSEKVKASEKLLVNVKISFDDLDENGIALVSYELLFDNEIFGINSVSKNSWNTKIYQDRDDRYYAISELSKNTDELKCSDNILYCGDYEVEYEFYIKDNKNIDTEIKIGDMIIGFLPIANNQTNLTTDDVVLINVSGKSKKNVQIIKSDDFNIGDMNDIILLKDKVEVTKKMVLESKDISYSLEDKDNYIEKLEVNGYDLKFRKYTNDYSLKVKSDVQKLDLKIELSNKQASFEVEDNDNLEDNNIVKIHVKALNGDINTYSIKIIKEKETINNKEKSSGFLGINIDWEKIDFKLIGIVLGSIVGLFLIIKLIIKIRDRKWEKAIKKL